MAELAHAGARDALIAASKYFANLNRIDILHNTTNLLSNFNGNLSDRYKYIIYKNLARALHIYDTEYAESHPDDYDYKGPIPVTVLGCFLEDRVVQQTKSRHLCVKIYASSLSDKDLEKYTIPDMTELPELDTMDFSQRTFRAEHKWYSMNSW